MAIYNVLKQWVVRKKSQARVSRRCRISVRSFSLALVAEQVGQQSTQQVIHVMDRGSDHYDTIDALQSLNPRMISLEDERKWIIVMVKASEAGHLATSHYRHHRSPIRGLNHVSKTTGKQVLRKARTAKLQIKYARTEWATPRGKKPLKSPVFVVMVQEDASTVPVGEDPIEWILDLVPVSTCKKPLE